MKTAPNTPTSADPDDAPAPAPPFQRAFFRATPVALVLASLIAAGAAVLLDGDPLPAAATTFALCSILLFVLLMVLGTTNSKLIDQIGAPRMTPRDEREQHFEHSAYRAAFLTLISGNMIGAILFLDTWAIYVAVLGQITWYGLRWYGDRKG